MLCSFCWCTSNSESSLCRADLPWAFDLSFSSKYMDACGEGRDGRSVPAAVALEPLTLDRTYETEACGHKPFSRRLQRHQPNCHGGNVEATSRPRRKLSGPNFGGGWMLPRPKTAICLRSRHRCVLFPRAAPRTSGASGGWVNGGICRWGQPRVMSKKETKTCLMSLGFKDNRGLVAHC